MYKFILDPAGLLAVIGAHTQGLCGHNGQKGQTGASVCRSGRSHTRGALTRIGFNQDTVLFFHFKTLQL